MGADARPATLSQYAGEPQREIRLLYQASLRMSTSVVSGISQKDTSLVAIQKCVPGIQRGPKAKPPNTKKGSALIIRVDSHSLALKIYTALLLHTGLSLKTLFSRIIGTPPAGLGSEQLRFAATPATTTPYRLSFQLQLFEVMDATDSRLRTVQQYMLTPHSSSAPSLPLI
jgi:hypothetical protein